MEYYQWTLTLRIPRPKRFWFRFRIRTLLLLMLLAACIATWRHLHVTSRHQRLVQELHQATANRDAALYQWRQAIFRIGLGGSADVEDINARADYFCSTLKKSTGGYIARMRCQNCDRSRGFASRDGPTTLRVVPVGAWRG